MKKENITAEELNANLDQFLEIENYHKVTYYDNFLVTNGVNHLIKKSYCCWLMQLYASHLLNKKVYYFTILSLKLNNSGGADIKIKDRNGNILSEESIENIDFPLNEIYLSQVMMALAMLACSLVNI